MIGTQTTPMRWMAGPLDIARRQKEKSFTPEIAETIRQWLDPSLLALVQGTPVNCLVVSWASGLPADAEQQQALKPLLEKGVFSPQPVDPNNSEAVKAVLDSLIDQQVVLESAKAANYSDPKFDEMSKNKLIEAGNQIKDIKDRLVQDMETVNRLEKTYKESYLHMLLAQSYAASRMPMVQVSEQDIKDRYATYKKQMEQEGQAAPTYEKIRQQVGVRVKADKLMSQLEATQKVTRDEDAIQKYLTNLSTSSALLQDQPALPQPATPSAASKPGKE